MGKEKKTNRPLSVFKTGVISLAFLMVGYQLALFIHHTASVKLEANTPRTDTVFVIDAEIARQVLEPSSGNVGIERRSGSTAAQDSAPAPKQTPAREYIVKKKAPENTAVTKFKQSRRAPESFKFNPNTASVEDLIRLGFSEKQALSIDNYRAKGGKFRRKSDFAKSYVVADSVFKRLEPFIDIPLLDINKADSAQFDALPGIGGYFAAKMVSFREMLGGYSHPEQLLDIYNFGEERYEKLRDLIECSPPADSFKLWTLSPDELRKHPYIKDWNTAKSIVFFRENNSKDKWTVEELQKAGVLSEEKASKLSRCAISSKF